MLCLTRLRQIKDFPPIIGMWTNQKLQKIFFAKSATFGVKGILLPLVHSINLTSYISMA